jgi:hypothetical protein
MQVELYQVYVYDSAHDAGRCLCYPVYSIFSILVRRQVRSCESRTLLEEDVLALFL